MKIAVPHENGRVFQHFGKSKQFKIYTVEDDRILSSEVYSNDSGIHCALAGVLSELGVSKLICGGIGGGARNAVAAAGIELFAGAQGDIDEQVAAFLRNGLMYNADFECDCHGHSDHHDCEHHRNCGHH